MDRVLWAINPSLHLSNILNSSTCTCPYEYYSSTAMNDIIECYIKEDTCSNRNIHIYRT